MRSRRVSRIGGSVAPSNCWASASSCDMYTKSVVDQSFKIVFTIGTYVGARLLHRPKPGDPFFEICSRKFMFLALILAYCFGTLLLMFLALPIPVNGSVPFTLDVYMAYPVIWGGFLLDGFACFVTINFSTRYLLDDSGFVDRCREVALVAQPTFKQLNHWKRASLFITFIFAGLLLSQFAVTVLAATGILKAPVHMERVVYWTSMPSWLSWTVIGILAAMATLHIGYHCIFFSNQVEITRLHLRTFSDSLADEKAVAMTKRQVDTYHAEYCRLIAMVHNLDHAFRASTFCQLSLVTVGSCLILFLFTKEKDAEWDLMIYVIFTLAAILFTFSFTAVPAILMDLQIYRPKALVRAWFLKYEQRRNIYEYLFDEQARSALGLFMQSINAEDAAITIASLAKLNVQLLLTLASLIMTYFLVIMQFDQTTCAPLQLSNITEICMASGFHL